MASESAGLTKGGFEYCPVSGFAAVPPGWWRSGSHGCFLTSRPSSESVRRSGRGRARARNERADQMTTMPMSSTTNSGPVRGKGARAAWDGLLRRNRSRDGEYRDEQPVARKEHREAERGVVEGRVGGQTGERAAVVVAGGGEGIEDLREAVGTWIKGPARAGIERARRSRCRPAPPAAESGSPPRPSSPRTPRPSCRGTRACGLIIKPAMKRATSANTIMPYSPEPTPPKITSPTASAT